MKKEIKDMTKEEILTELQGLEHQIALSSFGRFELVYRELLFRELERRGIEVVIYPKIEEIK